MRLLYKRRNIVLFVALIAFLLYLVSVPPPTAEMGAQGRSPAHVRAGVDAGVDPRAVDPDERRGGAAEEEDDGAAPVAEKTGKETTTRPLELDKNLKGSVAIAVQGMPKCLALGDKFVSYLTEYLSAKHEKKLVYSCESNKPKHFCGGMGDRFRGMITTMFTAMVAKRQFYLYHPVPVPIEKYLEPNLLPWVPGDDVRDIPVNMELMRIKNHKKFFAHLSSSKADGHDVRVQSNSFSVDPFLQAIPKYKAVITQEMGLRPQCNLTCYFGCLYDVLFKPTGALRKELSAVMRTLPGHHKEKSGRKYISLQVRMGGSWAAGMRIAEPFRTPPEALPHFWSVLRELRNQQQFFELPIFVSSDSQRLINETVKEFGDDNVFFVQGDAFQHIDTLNLNEVKPKKYKALPKEESEETYMRTLLNHYLIGNGVHVVMAQSGYGDTAFWRGRTSATAIFIDMKNLRTAWQHHLEYKEPGDGPATATSNRIFDIRSKPQPFY